MSGKIMSVNPLLHAHPTAAVVLVIVAAVLAIYSRTAHHEFIELDDDKYVYENAHVKGGLTLDGLRWAFTTGHASNWHPVTWLSHMLDCELFGPDPGRHHLVNVLLHAGNAVLLFLVLSRFTGAVWKSAFAALFFAVHPLRVESVAWIAERKDVLSTFFLLLTLLAYFRYCRRPSAGRYLAVFCLFALGLMAKPMLVTLPPVLLLLDYWPLRRTGRSGVENVSRGAGDIPRPVAGKARLVRLVVEKLPLFALSAASSAVTLAVQKSGGAVGTLEAYPLGTRTANALVSYAAYLLKTVWPARLAVLYPYHPISLFSWKAVSSAAVLAIITLGVVRSARRYPFLFTGWFWYMVTLVPVIGFVKVGVQSMADRYTYIPGMGLGVIVAWGVPEAVKRIRRGGGIPAAVPVTVLCIYAVLARLQVARWHDTGALFEHTLAVTADNVMIHDNYGVYLVKRGRYEEGRKHLEAALRLNPEYYESYNNLGIYYARRNELGKAVEMYGEALRLKPDFAKAHNNLGNALSRLGRLDEAAAHIKKALEISPDYPEAHNNLAAVLVRQGRFEEARRHLTEALRLKPDFRTARENLEILEKRRKHRNERQGP